MTRAGSSTSSLRWLEVLARADGRRLAWVVALQLLAALTQGAGLLLLVPLLDLAGVDDASGPAADGSGLRVLGLDVSLRLVLVGYVLVVAAAAALNAFQSVEATRFRLWFVDDMRQQLFRAVARARWRDLLTLRRSDLTTALVNNVALVSQGVLAALRLGVTGLVVLVQVAVAVHVSPAVTALALVTGGVVVLLVRPLLRRSRALGKEVVLQNRRLMASVAQLLDGLRLAKLHGLAGQHVSGFEQDLRAGRAAQVRFARAAAVSGALQLTVTGAVLAVVVGAAVEVLELPVARLLVVAFIFSRVVPQLVSAQQALSQMSQALPALDELQAHLHRFGGADDGADDGPVQPEARCFRLPRDHVLRFDAVSFAYPSAGEQLALRDVSLDLPALTTTALVGPSGSGKTTLADLAVGLLEPTAGAVLVAGRPLVGPAVHAWRSAVAVAPQEAFLFHDTIRNNLTWIAPHASEADLWEALDLAAARPLVEALPAGLDTIVGDRGLRLSGGERQRIAIARAVLRRPELLVLDEATSALDTESDRAVREALSRLRGGLTVLLIAHRLETVRHADLVVVVDGGAVVETGTWDELTRRRGGRLRGLVAAGALG